MVNSTREKNNKVIFCQAPADIPFVLTIYKKYNDISLISIYVINVQGMFDFFIDLNLNVDELVYIPYSLKNLKSINAILKEKKRINLLYKKYFASIRNADVYFFAKYEDWLTAAFVSRLSKNKSINVNYVDHNDNLGELYKSKSIISLKIVLYLSILKFVTNVWFKANKIEILPEFPFSNYAIQKIHLDVEKSVFIKHQYNFNFSESEKINAILFVSPCEVTIFDSVEYDKTLQEVIEVLKKVGFSTFVKGHPRLGLPNNIENIVDFVIPSYVPGEFINSNLFGLCLGIDTTAITHFAKYEKIPTYSLAKFFPASRLHLHDVAIEYLKQQSNDKIRFCDTMNDLHTIALNIKTEFYASK